MIRIGPMNNTEFRAGDQVVLADGPYEGTPGVFVTRRADLNWADIRESNNIIREHPVIWLEHSNQPVTARGTAGGSGALIRQEHPA